MAYQINSSELRNYGLSLKSLTALAHAATVEGIHYAHCNHERAFKCFTVAVECRRLCGQFGQGEDAGHRHFRIDLAELTRDLVDHMMDSRNRAPDFSRFEYECATYGVTIAPKFLPNGSRLRHLPASRPERVVLMQIALSMPNLFLNELVRQSSVSARYYPQVPQSVVDMELDDGTLCPPIANAPTFYY